MILILGILASVAAPRMLEVSQRAEITSMLTERDVILSAIELSAAATGSLPADQMGGDFPPELASYLRESTFTVNRPLTGTWDWSLAEFGLQASLALADWTADLRSNNKLLREII